MAHYETTGPEIRRDTEGKITHYAAGVGTGADVRYRKIPERAKLKSSPSALIIAGRCLKNTKRRIFDENEIYPYLTEGIGEDILPKNVDFSVIDHFIKVTDKDAAVMTRRLSKEEGLFVGWSCGSAVHGALEYAKENLKEGDRMVIILPDHGTRYLGKIYNDDWMRNHGFLEDKTFGTARDIISSRNGSYQLLVSQKTDKVKDTIHLMNSKSVSQIPVMEDGHVVGSITDSKLLSKIIENPDLKDASVADVMEDS